VTEPVNRVWRKSTYSGHNNTCVELLTPPPQDQAPIRNSQHPETVIIFRAEAWTAFLYALRHGEIEPAPRIA
jgi:hypothetical protein